MKRKVYFASALVWVSALMSVPAFGDSNVARNGFSFCESALKQLPLVQKDSKIEGRNVLGFVHFNASGKPEVNGDPNVNYIQNNDAGDVQTIGIDVNARKCTKWAKMTRRCVDPSEAHKEDVSFTYQDGRVKDVTVQHFQDGAWIRDKLTFLLSKDESTCYVQHMHSDVEIYQTANVEAAEFDLETCKLANDVRSNSPIRKAVLKAGGLDNFKPCSSKFAKAAMARYFLDNPGSDATFHKNPVVTVEDPINQAPGEEASAGDQPKATAASAN